MRYRQIWVFVACFFLLGTAAAQVAKPRAVSKGPRALALIEVDSKGRSHLIPVTIMVGGKFYDASVYKADPIPMALQSGTIYEGLKSGVSQGLFTVKSSIPQNGWMGLGIWKTNEQIEAEKEKAKARTAKLSQKYEEDIKAGGPPRLSRTPEGAHPKTADSTSPKKPDEKKSDEKKSDDTTDRPVLHKQSSESEQAASLAAVEADRPVLRHQQAGEVQEQKATPDTSPLQGKLDVVPAISDAGGPQPRPYTFQTKPEEDQDFMKKMSAMAAEEVKRRVGPAESSDRKLKSARSISTPAFRDQQLKVLDISGTNEAVLIYSATADAPGGTDLQISTTVVARQDLYGDLHKVFAQTTDSRHLDVQPRYEFIDAVDADGDGRGELLFKHIGDSGTGYALYRLIGDRLWPLFEGKPGT